MVGVDKVLPKKYVDILIEHNIRSLEQFLSVVEVQNQWSAMAEMLGITIEEVKSLVDQIHKTYPDLKVPKRSKRKYPLGYGKSSDISEDRR